MPVKELTDIARKLKEIFPGFEANGLQEEVDQFRNIYRDAESIRIGEMDYIVINDVYKSEDVDKVPDDTSSLFYSSIHNTYAIIDAETSSTQTLVFWHMMSKINIGAEFKDANGQAATGNLTNVRIENVDSKMAYSIKYSTPSDTNLNGLVVECNPLNQKTLTSLTFNETVAAKVDGKWSAHILPQVVSDFVIYIDYDIVEDGKTTYYKDVKYTMRNANPSTYSANGQYNWTFRIGPREDISFKVTVAPWTSSDVSDGDDSDDNNDIEII